MLQQNIFVLVVTIVGIHIQNICLCDDVIYFFQNIVYTCFLFTFK